MPVLFFVSPRKELTNRIPLWVLVVTCMLEILQLWHPWILDKKFVHISWEDTDRHIVFFDPFSVFLANLK